MLNLVIYEAKVALLLAIFYICYRVLLSRETLHRLNRIVLTGSVLVSFILPFCVLTVHRTVEVAAGADAPAWPALPALPQGPAEAVAAAAAAEAPNAAVHGSWWPAALAMIYIAGVLFCLVRIAVELVQVSRIIRSGESNPQDDGTALVIVDRDIAPFSWMKWIVLSREDYESGNTHILKHERAHIRLGHARDLLFIDILSAMQWFNPVMQMLKDDLRAVYEYEADDAVLREGANIKEYQYSLIRKAVSASGYSITNSFNHSILKNRITMMSKQKSVTLRGLRALYVVPLVAAGLACNSQTVTDYKVSEDSSETKAAGQEFPGPRAINLQVVMEGEDVRFYLNGNPVSLDEVGKKVNDVRGEDNYFYVNIIGDPEVQIGYLQDLKEELRKIDALKIMYSCKKPEVKVERKLEPIGAAKSVLEFMERSSEGDVQIRLNSLDKLLYLRTGGKKDINVINQEDLFDLAKNDIEKNNGISFFFIADRGSSYGAYSVAVQSVYDAFRSVREDLAMQEYGKTFDELEEEQQDELREKCSVRIYESSK
ncbi:MAG: M56 family metallopeptidase [Bacteroidales bacterium]|nr:M56 family metallopeptidase [Bacteroidales bacterium]MBR4479804.1 M56 family metallopeptidase [Bacteroidales bacterium]